jgi:hypothetical protein
MPFPTYAKKDAIPAGAEDVYEEKDGQWVPKLPDVDGLKTTLEKVRGEKKDAEKAAKEAADLRAAAERERDALKTQIGDPEGKTKALLEKFDADTKAAVAAVQKQLDDATGRLRTLTLDDKAKAAFVKAGGRPDRADAALKLARERLDLAEDRIVVKDVKGDVTTMAVEDYWSKDFAKEMPEMFTGTMASGGDARGGTGTHGGSGGLTADQILANPDLALEAANRAA